MSPNKHVTKQRCVTCSLLLLLVNVIFYYALYIRSNSENQKTMILNADKPRNAVKQTPDANKQTPDVTKQTPDINKQTPKYVLPVVNLSVNWSNLNEACSDKIRKAFMFNVPDSYPNQYGHHLHPDHYKYYKIPKRTFSYWLSHFEGKNRLLDKAYFADKYRVKQYIENYTKIENGTFSYIHYARALIHEIDYIHESPSYEELVALQEKYGALLVKPNHYCSKQIIITKDTNFTVEKYNEVLQFARKYINKKYTESRAKGYGGNLHLEDHYLYIKPQIFIEEHLNVNQSEENDHWMVNESGESIDDMIEYRFIVINYKCVILYIVKKPFTNLYTADNFTLLQARWGQKYKLSMEIKPPSTQNFERMKRFSEHFAKREQLKFVRVDLYELRNEIYFSEFTFTPAMTTGKIIPVAFDYALYDIVCNASRANIDKIYKFVAKKNIKKKH